MIEKGYRMGSQGVITESLMAPTFVKLSETMLPPLIQKEELQLLGASQKDKDTLTCRCMLVSSKEVSSVCKQQDRQNKRILDLEEKNRRLETELSETKSKATEEEIKRKECEVKVEQQMQENDRLRRQVEQLLQQQVADLQPRRHGAESKSTETSSVQETARHYPANSKSTEPNAMQETAYQHLNVSTTSTSTSESGELIQQESSLEECDFVNDCRWMDTDEKNDDFYYQRHLAPQVMEKNEHQNDIPDIVESCGAH